MISILRFSFTLVLGAILLMHPHGVHANTLPIQDAIFLALRNSPDINIADSQTRQALFAVDEGKSIYYPQIDFFGEAGREFNSPANSRGSTIATGQGASNASANATLSINQYLFDGNKTQKEIARRKQLITSSEIQALRIEEQVIMDTIESYLSIVKEQRMLKEAKEFVARLQVIESKLMLMVNAGAESPSKLKYIQSRLASAYQNQITINENLEDAKNTLEKLMGRPAEFQAQYDPKTFLTLDSLEDYYAHAAAHNKEIIVQQSDKKALIDQLKSLDGNKYPTLNALVRLNQSHDVSGEVGRDRNASAMLQTNYRIFDGFANKASKNRILSQIEEVNERIDKAKREINRRIKNLNSQYKSLPYKWGALEEEIVANNSVRMSNALKLQLGEADILELVESEERYFSSKTKKHETEFDFAQTIYQLMQQAGLLHSNHFNVQASIEQVQ